MQSDHFFFPTTENVSLLHLYLLQDDIITSYITYTCVHIIINRFTKEVELFADCRFQAQTIRLKRSIKINFHLHIFVITSISFRQRYGKHYISQREKNFNKERELKAEEISDFGISSFHPRFILINGARPYIAEVYTYAGMSRSAKCDPL